MSDERNPHPHRRAGRPTTPLLTRDRIAEAGLALFDRDGGFTMAALARELRVRPSSLYNHVSSKDDVIAGIRERVSDRIDVAVFERGPWAEAVTAWAESYRDAFAAHPSTIATLATMPLAGATRTTQMYERVTAGFLAAGWPRDRALSAIVCLESFVLGSALDAAAPADMFALPDDAAAPSFRDAYEARRQRLAGTHPSDDAFRTGLRALVRGLEAELREVRAGEVRAGDGLPRVENSPSPEPSPEPRP